MSRLDKFATKRPVGFGLAIALVFVVLSVASFAVGAAFPGGPIQQQVGQALGRVVFSILFILVVWRLDWLNEAGLTSSGDRVTWLLILPPSAYAIITSLYAMFGAVSFGLPDSPLAAVEAHNQ